MSRSTSSQAKWGRMMREQQSSGQTVTAFCRQRSVPQSSFFAWKRRLGLVGRRKQAASVRFVAVNPVDDGSGGGVGDGSSIELCLGRDRRLMVRRGF